MSEKFEEQKKPEVTVDEMTDPLMQEAEEEMARISEAYQTDMDASIAKMSDLKDHYEAVQTAHDSLLLLHKELIQDFGDVLGGMIKLKMEVSDANATSEEAEREFQSNQRVTLDLRSAGLTSLLDPNVNEEEVKEKLLTQVLMIVSARAIMNRPENRVFQEEATKIQEKLGNGLSEVTHSADFGADDDAIEVVEERLREYAILSKKVLDECIADTRELFFNR